MTVVGLPQHHPRQKRPQRHRQPQRMGHVGSQQRHQQGAQHKKLVGAGPRHLVKQQRQQPLAHRQQSEESKQPLEGGPGDLGGQGAPLHFRLGEDRDHHQQGHHRQILKQQHAHPQLGAAGMELLLLAELLDHHSRRGECQRPRHHQRLGQTQPPPPADGEKEQ